MSERHASVALFACSLEILETNPLNTRLWVSYNVLNLSTLEFSGPRPQTLDSNGEVDDRPSYRKEPTLKKSRTGQADRGILIMSIYNPPFSLCTAHKDKHDVNQHHLLQPPSTFKVVPLQKAPASEHK